MLPLCVARPVFPIMRRVSAKADTNTCGGPSGEADADPSNGTDCKDTRLADR